jgi:Ca2+-binding EF-hand superfamily protein
MTRSTQTLSRLVFVSAAAALATTFALAQTAKPTKPTEPSATDKTAVEAAFTRADANGDGKLSRDEAARMPAVYSKFDQLDKDKDSGLSFEEFAAGAMAAPK